MYNIDLKKAKGKKTINNMNELITQSYFEPFLAMLFKIEKVVTQCVRHKILRIGTMGLCRDLRALKCPLKAGTSAFAGHSFNIYLKNKKNPINVTC